MHRIIYRHHRLILLLSFLLTLPAIALTSRIRLETDLFSLLPARNPGVRAFLETAEEIGFQSVLIGVVEFSSEWPDPAVHSFMDLLAARFAEDESVNEVEYKRDADSGALFPRLLVRFLPLFLEEEDLRRLAFKLSDEGIRRQVRENRRILSTPFGLAAKEWILLDPLGFREFLERRATLHPGTEKEWAGEGYYRSSDGKTCFLFVKPKRPPQDIAYSKELLSNAKGYVQAAIHAHSMEFQVSPSDVQVAFTGAYPIAVRDEAVMRKDIHVMIVSSFLGIMILFGLCFRSLKVLPVIGVTMAFAILWTFGFASLVFQRLNLLTCIFSCVIIGLGIDFAIHIVNRWYSHEKEGMDERERLARVFQETGGALVTGALTTAIAFFAVAYSDFRGFRELGILTGTGILFCLVVMMVVLPSFLTYLSSRGFVRKIAMSGFGLNHALGFIWQRPGLLLVGTLTLIGCLGYVGMGIRFDSSFRSFRPSDDQVFRLQEKVSQWLGGSTTEVLVVVEGTSESEVQETNDRVYRALKGLRDSGEIAAMRSISRFLTPPSEQSNTIRFLRQDAAAFDMDRIRSTFYDALLENGFEGPGLYDEYLEALGSGLSTRSPVLLSRVDHPEAAGLLKLFAFTRGGTTRMITYIRPPADLSSPGEIDRFRETLSRRMIEKGIPSSSFCITGVQLLGGELKSLILENLENSLWLAGFGVLAILILRCRSILLVLLSVFPLLLALQALFGIMVLSGLELNFFNAVVLTMLIGMGIDDGVHLASIFKRSGEADRIGEIAHTARAIVLTSLTTIVGFGSVALSHYPGLKSMGYLAVIGMIACLFTSLVVLPSLFALMSKKTGK